MLLLSIMSKAYCGSSSSSRSFNWVILAFSSCESLLLKAAENAIFDLGIFSVFPLMFPQLLYTVLEGSSLIHCLLMHAQ